MRIFFFALIINFESMEIFHQIAVSCAHSDQSMLDSVVQFKIAVSNLQELMRFYIFSLKQFSFENCLKKKIKQIKTHRF